MGKEERGLESPAGTENRVFLLAQGTVPLSWGYVGTFLEKFLLKRSITGYFFYLSPMGGTSNFATLYSTKR